MTLDERYQTDDRVRPLLGDCGFGAPFEADTTDLAEVLASKLDAGALLLRGNYFPQPRQPLLDVPHEHPVNPAGTQRL